MNQAHNTAALSATKASPATLAGDRKASSEALHALVLAQLDDDQAQDVVSIDLEGKSSIADHMVVATGRSTRQLKLSADQIKTSCVLFTRVWTQLNGRWQVVTSQATALAS